ncbi:MAG: polysaccharide biosynthesis protein [Actinomycetota bacterium]|nr:polysaccharide biosynthesis protein [Actinomycetota bacterium]MDQ3716324.1 polysaccharide biosynthesis protein [Actinomycetota bacterium]
MQLRVSRGQWLRLVQVAVDVTAWTLGLWLAHFLRYDLVLERLFTMGVLYAALSVAVLQVAFGFLGHLYRGRYRYGSFDEVLGVLLAAACAAVGLAVLNETVPAIQWVPRSVPFVGAFVAFTFMLGVRYLWRMRQEGERRSSGRRVGDVPQPLLLFGAGEGADQAIVAMLRDMTSRYRPVGLLDDDPSKGNLRLRGVPVLGTRQDLARAAAETGATSLLLAVPSADGLLVREISGLASDAGLTVKVLPTVDHLLYGRVGVEDIRDLDLPDLLGRRQIELDLDSIAGYLTGKRVLVTGAGGSIGSELCRQISLYAPGELIMLDRDESALHAVQLSITGRALLDGEDLVLADIRDIDQMHRIFVDRQPQVVFHAAALKHLTLLERFPGEAVKSNIWGTLTVLEAARDAGVEHFVNISTDKAADPTSVLGYSKRIAERLTADVARRSEGTFVSVRFGNVLGSRGSVLTAFTAQIATGGPVTVTHPDVTRYFMTVQEAVQLVIQAASVGNSGEVLVLDMGEPVRIDDVARRLVDQAARKVEIVYTGLRSGEKLHEDLLGVSEADVRPCHPLVSQVPVEAVAPADALALDPWETAPEVISALRTACALGDRETEMDTRARAATDSA